MRLIKIPEIYTLLHYGKCATEVFSWKPYRQNSYYVTIVTEKRIFGMKLIIFFDHSRKVLHNKKNQIVSKNNNSVKSIVI